MVPTPKSKVEQTLAQVASTPGTVLITGGARRLGAALARELGKAGWDVVVHYKSSREPAEELVQELKDMGRRAWAVRADLSDPESCAPLIETAANLSGGLEALVCNASIFDASTLFDLSAKDIQDNVQIHATGPLLLARRFSELPSARQILNLLDSKITGPDDEHFAYHLSKRMLADLTRSMAVALAPRVAVNGVAPGAVLPAPGKSQEEFDALAQDVPMKRTGSPGDITTAALYLLTSEFVTGQVLFVDGGRHLQGNLYG
jgi:pteridine reductase